MTTLLKGKLANHYYYGRHKTGNLNDGYAGSGKIIKDYFKHYEKIEGVTYTKDIVAFYDNDDELNKAEKILIGKKYKNDPLCLNLMAGGIGDYNGAKIGHTISEETKKKISDKLKGHKLSEETKQKISEWNKSQPEEKRKKFGQVQRGKEPWNKGKTGVYSEESIQKMRKPHNFTEESKRKFIELNKNRVWVHIFVPQTQQKIQKRVHKDYLDYWLDDGWILGR